MKKITALLFAALIILTAMLSGCTDTAPQASSTNAAASPTVAAAAPTSAAATSAPAEPEPLPLTKLTVEVFDRGNMESSYGTPTDNKWTQLIKDAILQECNIEVEYFAVPRNDEISQLNVLMAAGTAPDIVFTYETPIWQNYCSLGGVADLTEPIQLYGENILANMSDALPYGQFEGRQMALFAKRANVTMRGAFMRKDWADALNIEIGMTDYGGYSMSVEDVYNAMKAFAEANLDGAPAGQVWGMSNYGTSHYAMLALIEAFYDQQALTDEILAVYPPFMWPNAKEGYRFVNQLFNEGLVYPDFALISGVMDKTLFGEHITNGNVGIWFNDGTYGFGNNGVYETLRQNTPTAEVITFEVLNQEGKPSYKQVYAPIGFVIFVPSFSKNVDGAVMYLNWLADYQNDRVLRLGFEGEHYDMVDGVPTVIDLDYNTKTRVSTGDLCLMYNGNPNLEENLAATLINLPEPDRPIREMAELIDNYNSFAPATFTSVIRSELDYSVALEEKEGELRVKIIMCKPEDFDATWDKLVNEYLSIGGQAVIDEKQAVWNEFYK
ncbi:MAG: hypothetical protein ACOX8S_04090 [Christensenellales bacterium]|jgi:putative aldouronate transport system substrate-binding protein